MSQANILIKNKSGQLRTVDLRSGNNQATTALINIRTGQATANAGQVISDKQLVTTADAGQASDKEKIINDNPEDSGQKEAEKVLQPMAKEMVMPAFYFNREDEEEAAQFKSLEKRESAIKNNNLISYVVEQIIKDSRITGAGNNVRLVRAIESRLREVRDLMETKEVLARPMNLGGAGLDAENVSRVLRVIEEYRLRLLEGNEKIFPLTSDKRQVTTADAGQARDKEKEEKKETEKIVESKVAPAVPMAKPTNLKVINEIVPVHKHKVPQPSYAETVINTARAERAPSRLTGPAEELASLTLENFRALGADTDTIKQKIKEKIDLLTDESYEKRTVGIRNWRRSPVNQIYLKIGNESVDLGQGVAEIIKKSEQAHQPILTLDEFQAIADLNEQLSY